MFAAILTWADSRIARPERHRSRASDERRPHILSILIKTHHRRTSTGVYQEYAVHCSAQDVDMAPSTAPMAATQLCERL